MSAPRRIYDLNPVDRITTDAVGEPGKRVFYVQARKGRRLVSVLVEKEHVALVAHLTEQFLLALAESDPDAVVEPDAAALADMSLEVPLVPVFRAGQVGLGYDQVSRRLVLVAHEQVEEGEERRPAVARFWATPSQMRAFSLQGRQVVEAGRARCAMCGEPINPEGHFCPRKNGDRKRG